MSPDVFFPSLSLRLQNEKWMNVRVGDIIKLENNQFVAVRQSLMLWYTSLHKHRNTHDERVFQHRWLTKVLLTVPAASVDANLSSWICFQADLLLLSTSEPHGLCYIETAELDGSDNAARFIPDAQYLTIYRSSGARPLKGCVFFPAERPIWRCASPSLWHPTLETRTTWLRLMVRSQSKISLFSGFWHLLFHDNLKVNPHVFHPRTQQSKHTLCFPAPALNVGLSSPAHRSALWKTSVSALHKYTHLHTHARTHTHRTCSGKCNATAIPTHSSLVSAYRRGMF